MRITLAQLLKTSMPFTFNEKLDVSTSLVGLEDILETSLADVSYVFSKLDDETYLIRIKIEVDLVLEGPVTLERYPKHIVVESDEIYSKRLYNDDSFVIEGQTIDTSEAVVMNILLAKPMRITDEEFQDDDLLEQEEYVNPAFANLKDLL